jgi:hypothetical protein
MLVDGRGAQSILLEDVVSSRPLSITNMAAGALNIRGNVRASNFQSASISAVVAISGNSYYRHLPDGMIEQFGFISVPPATNTTITFPKPFRTGSNPVMSIVPRDGTETTHFANADATTGTITRPAGSGTLLYQWTARGQF